MSDASGQLNEECEAGKQLHITAPSGVLFTSTPATVRKVNFKNAPVKLKLLGLLGGGASTLPSGYLAAEFLESTGTQYMKTNLLIKDSHVQVKGQASKRNGTCICGLYENFGSYRDLSIKLIQNNNDTVGVEAKARNKTAYRYNLPIGTAFDAEVDLLQNFASVKEYSSGNSYKINIANEGYIYSDKPVWFVCSKNVVGSNVATGNATDKFVGRLLNFKVGYNGQLSADFVPSVSETGKPCLYDKITKKPFYNSGTGQFIVGMTLKQARKLSKLPSTGGSLTVSLPWEAQLVQHNGEVESALGTAQGNGWLVGVQYRDAESDSAVYNKYNECTMPTKVKEVNADYGTDLTADGEWIYPLSNLKSGTDDWVVGLFTDAAIKNVDMEFPAMLYADYLFFNNKTLESAILYLPNATTLNRVLTQTKNMTYAEIKLNGQGVTKCYDVISRGSKTKKIKVWNVGEWVGSSCFHESPNLEEFEFEAQKLTSMHAWFNNNYKLRRVSINDVSKVTTGYQCYDNCYVLEEFPTVYPVLSDGAMMFRGCRLKKQHAIEILNGIPAWSSGTHSITVGIHVDFKDDAEIAEAVASAEAKGWTVTVQWNGTAGTSGASTYGLRRQPIYAKVVEHDGKQNLDWGHYVTNAEENGYQEFASVEEAEEYFGIEKENNA